MSRSKRGRAALRPRMSTLGLAYALLAGGVLVALVPFLYVLSTSLKDTDSLFNYPPEWIPVPLYWDNYFSLLKDHLFLRWTFNTLVVAGSVTVLKVWFDSMAAYALARMQFLGRGTITVILLFAVAIPIAALIIPLFFVLRVLGILDTYWALILPPLANPLGIFMARSFIVGLPRDLENSARLDGANEFAIYGTIVLPLIRPGLVVLAMWTFMVQYTSFLLPLVAIQSDAKQVLTVGITTLIPAFTTDWGLVSAAMVLMVIPITVAFLFAQRHFVANDLAGALKE